MVVISGGARLEAHLAQLAKKLNHKQILRVGFLEGATYPDGTHVATVAVIQEFGAGPIPPRPFFRTMIAEKSDAWGNQLARLLKKTDYDVQKALSFMGEGIKSQLQASIVATNSPELSAITLMLRHMKHEDPDLVVTGATVGEAARRVAAGESSAGVSTKPLVDTGHMLNSVDYEVE